MTDPGCELRTWSDALYVGRACDEAECLWFEDPYPRRQRLRRRAEVAPPEAQDAALGQLVRARPEQKAAFALAGGCDMIHLVREYDLGITGAMKIAHMTKSIGMHVQVHTCGPAHRACVAAIRNTRFYELALIGPGMPDLIPHVYAWGYSDQAPAVAKDGCVELPTGPSLGVTYDWGSTSARTRSRAKNQGSEIMERTLALGPAWRDGLLDRLAAALPGWTILTGAQTDPESARRATVVVPFAMHVGAPLLEGSSIRPVHQFGVGVDPLDLEAARRLGGLGHGRLGGRGCRPFNPLLRPPAEPARYAAGGRNLELGRAAQSRACRQAGWARRPRLDRQGDRPPSRRLRHAAGRRAARRRQPGRHGSGLRVDRRHGPPRRARCQRGLRGGLRAAEPCDPRPLRPCPPRPVQGGCVARERGPRRGDRRDGTARGPRRRQAERGRTRHDQCGAAAGELSPADPPQGGAHAARRRGHRGCLRRRRPHPRQPPGEAWNAASP
jgi:hypothetical protein